MFLGLTINVGPTTIDATVLRTSVDRFRASLLRRRNSNVQVLLARSCHRNLLGRLRFVNSSLDVAESLGLHGHELLDLTLQTSSLDCFFNDLESQECDLLVNGCHYGPAHLLDHVLVARLLAIGDELWVHVLIDGVREPLVDVVQVDAEFLELLSEHSLVVRDVKISLCGCVDEAVLLPDREHILLQAQVLKVVDIDGSDPYAFGPFDLGAVSRVLIEKVPYLLHLHAQVTSMLIAKELVERLELAEFKHSIVLKICGREYVIDVLKLLCLQLVSRVNDKLCKVVHLHSFRDCVQMHHLLTDLLWHLDLLLPDLLE